MKSAPTEGETPTMQWAFFRIPVNDSAAATESFNKFLRQHRILAVHREFVPQGESSYWALAVEYLLGEGGAAARREPGKKERVDYRELLPPETFARYARLRDWRKAAGESEGVPVYTIFTNEQLAEIARRDCRSLKELGEIEGVGPGRLQKYGRAVLAVLCEELPSPGAARHPLPEGEGFDLSPLPGGEGQG